MTARQIPRSPPRLQAIRAGGRALINGSGENGRENEAENLPLIEGQRKRSGSARCGARGGGSGRGGYPGGGFPEEYSPPRRRRAHPMGSGAAGGGCGRLQPRGARRLPHPRRRGPRRRGAGGSCRLPSSLPPSLAASLLPSSPPSLSPVPGSGRCRRPRRSLLHNRGVGGRKVKGGGKREGTAASSSSSSSSAPNEPECPSEPPNGAVGRREGCARR